MRSRVCFWQLFSTQSGNKLKASRLVAGSRWFQALYIVRAVKGTFKQFVTFLWNFSARGFIDIFTYYFLSDFGFKLIQGFIVDALTKYYINPVVRRETQQVEKYCMNLNLTVKFILYEFGHTCSRYWNPIQDLRQFERQEVFLNDWNILIEQI